MNVALTRAKFGLIVIGKRDILLLDPCWKAFLEFCGRNGLVDGVVPDAGQEMQNSGKVTRLEKVLLMREEEMVEDEEDEGQDLGDTNGTEEVKVKAKPRLLRVFPQEDPMWTHGMQAALDAGPGSEDEDEDDHDSQGSHRLEHDVEYKYEHDGSNLQGGEEGW